MRGGHRHLRRRLVRGLEQQQFHDFQFDKQRQQQPDAVYFQQHGNRQFVEHAKFVQLQHQQQLVEFNGDDVGKLAVEQFPQQPFDEQSVRQQPHGQQSQHEFREFHERHFVLKSLDQFTVLVESFG